MASLRADSITSLLQASAAHAAGQVWYNITTRIKETRLRVVYDKGIYLPEIDLWLDARRRCGLSVISHAHADHIQHHQSIIATPATARIFEHRIKRTDALLLDFYEN